MAPDSAENDADDAFEAKHTRVKKKPAATNGSDALDLGIVFLERDYRRARCADSHPM